MLLTNCSLPEFLCCNEQVPVRANLEKRPLNRAGLAAFLKSEEAPNYDIDLKHLINSQKYL